MPVEFDCPDCGWHVINVVESIPRARCLQCQWIADTADPAERAHLRALLSKNDAPAD
jgi:rubredoxin